MQHYELQVASLCRCRAYLGLRRKKDCAPFLAMANESALVLSTHKHGSLPYLPRNHLPCQSGPAAVTFAMLEISFGAQGCLSQWVISTTSSLALCKMKSVQEMMSENCLLKTTHICIHYKCTSGTPTLSRNRYGTSHSTQQETLSVGHLDTRSLHIRCRNSLCSAIDHVSSRQGGSHCMPPTSEKFSRSCNELRADTPSRPEHQ